MIECQVFQLLECLVRQYQMTEHGRLVAILLLIGYEKGVFRQVQIRVRASKVPVSVDFADLRVELQGFLPRLAADFEQNRGRFIGFQKFLLDVAFITVGRATIGASVRSVVVQVLFVVVLLVENKFAIIETI